MKAGKIPGKKLVFPGDYSPAFPGCFASGLAAFSGRARSYTMTTAVIAPFLVLFRAPKENAPSSLCSYFILANLDLILFSNKNGKEYRRSYNVIPTEAERERSGVEGSGNWAICCWKESVSQRSLDFVPLSLHSARDDRSVLLFFLLF